MPFGRCECINQSDRGNLLFLLKSKIDELNSATKEADKKVWGAKTNLERLRLAGNKAKIMSIRDSLIGTRSNIMNIPICE